MSTNGIVSSDMPNTEPASEKITISSGMSSFSRYGRAAMARVMRRMATVMVPVSWTTLKAPPMTNRKAMMSAPSTKPRTGARSSISGPRWTLGRCRNVPGTVTCRPAFSTRWNSPEGSSQDSARTSTTRAMTMTRV